MTTSRMDKLSPRQREVLMALTQGLSNKEIARMLNIAEATTKIHVAGLLRNLNVRNRTEAAFKAGLLNGFTNTYQRPSCTIAHEHPQRTGGGSDVSSKKKNIWTGSARAAALGLPLCI